MKKVRMFLAFLVNYLIIWGFTLAIRLTVYIKTGILELTRKDFISPIVPSVILIALHLFLLEFLSEDKDKK